MRRTRDSSQYLNRFDKRDDIKDSVKNVLGNIFCWPTPLSILAIPTLSVETSKIEETPVAIEIALSILAIPTLLIETTVA